MSLSLSKDLIACWRRSKILPMANITAEDIDQVEIIGGGVRIQNIKSCWKVFQGKRASVHLNGDEAIVLGSAFRAANISKAFRVGRVERSVGMVDIIPFPLGLRLKNAPNATGDAAAPAAEKAKEMVKKRRQQTRATLQDEKPRCKETL